MSGLCLLTPPIPLQSLLGGAATLCRHSTVMPARLVEAARFRNSRNSGEEEETGAGDTVVITAVNWARSGISVIRN